MQKMIPQINKIYVQKVFEDSLEDEKMKKKKKKRKRKNKKT